MKTLSDPAHRFKVRKNAEQMNLTGLCIFNPALSVIYIEGAAKFVRNYKRLMLHRISWTSAARPKGDAGEIELAEDGTEPSNGAIKETVDGGGDGKTVSLEDNRCDLIWEGEIVERAFKNFRPKTCPTDGTAREALGPKLASRWDAAKVWKGEEDEILL